MKKGEMTYTALGFPVRLSGVSIRKVRGVDVPDVNLNVLQQKAFEALIEKPDALSGAEVRFIRSYLRMTQTEFGRVLNQSGHSIVSQWESKGLLATGMDFNTEIWLRLQMAKMLKQSDLVRHLENFLNSRPFQVSEKPKPIQIKYSSAA